MTMTPNNPKVEAILLQIQKSYAELEQLIAGPLANLEPGKLYQQPGNDEWSITQNLAHILEFMPYWATEVEKLVAKPGQNFGRTMGHEGRLQGIRDYESADLAQIKAALPSSFGPLEAVISTLKDSDLELTGVHSKHGEKSLEWFIEDFITRHLSDHIEQIREDVQKVG
ncbi:MAG: DinB family protein [Chloroflexota bacterium]|nr:DinB family protein [Chloroflexota bacterium]